jgi:hypothetical protein
VYGASGKPTNEAATEPPVASIALSPLAVDSYLRVWAMRRTIILARSFFRS